MNRSAMLAELQAMGFSNTTADVTRQLLWIDQAYLWVWNARDPQGVKINWSFENVPQATLSIISGSAAPTMPADFGDADWISDDQGNPLREMEPEQFDLYFASAVASGQTASRSVAYKVVDRQVTLGPTPSLAASYTMSYTRRVSHKNSSGVVVAGTFTDNSDVPLWPDHHMVVVFQAALVGHSSKSNPFAQLYATLRDDALSAMRADLEAEFAPAQTWGGGGWSSRGW